MTQDGPADARRKPKSLGLSSFVAVAALAGVILCAIGFSVLVNGVWRQVDALAAANSDAAQWTMAQTEVDLLTLLVAIHSGEHTGGPDLQDVRVRYNILYSRIKALREGQQFRDLRADPIVTEQLDAISGFLDRYVPAIDGPDAELAAALPGIDEELNGLRPKFRELSLRGVKLFASSADVQRQTLATILSRTGYLTLSLVLALLFGIGVLLTMYRRSTIAEREADDMRNRLQDVISTSFDAILAADIDGRLIEYNGAAERIFGYSRDEAIGRDMADLIIPAHLKAAHAAGMQRYRKTKERHVVGKGLVRLEAQRKDGSIFPVELSLSSRVSDNTEIFISYIRDISDRFAAERELIEARDNAVGGERAKAELLAVMSHEMRTPLNGILGSIELLEDSGLKSSQGRYVSAMKTSAKLLLHHVNGVLNMSQAEAGQLELTPTVVDPAELLQELVESQRHVIEANGNRILCDASAAPARIWVDPVRLRQLVLNLVGNANKFTRQGEIRVECDTIANGDQVEFRVIDDGIGIAEGDLERIFEEFRTLDTSYSRRTEGTGLGLAISRRLATAMGGEIGVDSELGEGSLFWVRLPIGDPGRLADPSATATPSKMLATGDDPVAQGGLQVLLVEDNEINRLVAREMLVRSGHSVQEAHDGQEGVHLANMRKFDVILMDISMPHLDGVAATGIIRNAEGPNQRTPIIALTAHALKEDTNRFSSVGINSILIKPLSMASLREALSASIRQSRELAQELGTETASVMAHLAETLGTERAHALLAAFRAEVDQLVERASAPGWHDETAGARADAVHKVAGSAAVVGAHRLREHLRAMETAIRAGSDGVARQQIPGLRGIWDETRVELAAILDDAPIPARGTGTGR